MRKPKNIEKKDDDLSLVASKTKDEAKDIVKANLESYNKKLVFQDRIIIVSILFVLINYFLIIEPNYSKFRELSQKTEKIESYNRKFTLSTDTILKLIPDTLRNSINLTEVYFRNTDSLRKLQNIIDTTPFVNSEIENIQKNLVHKDSVSIKYRDLEKQITEAKDAV